MAQNDQKLPSPAAVKDLTKPTYDTVTPEYPKTDYVGKAAETVVADVDGRSISLGEVGDAIRALPAATANQPFDQVYQKVLSDLMRRLVLVARGHGAGLDDDPVVRRKMRAASDEVLASMWLDRETKAMIKEEDILQYYKQLTAAGRGPVEVRLQLIATTSESAALLAIKEIQDGADFGEVAKRVSQDTTAANGGDAGYGRKSDWLPGVATVAFSMARGQMVAYPVLVDNIWFVLKVLDRRIQSVPPYASVRDQLLTDLQRSKIPAVAERATSSAVMRAYPVTGKLMAPEDAQ